MLYSNKTLKLFELIGRARKDVLLEAGARVGRGFADIGFEEFIVLPGNKLLSLLTGAVSALDQVKREHLFEILTPDRCIAEIKLAGFEINSIDYIDNRHWNVVLEGDQEDLSEQASSLEECLLKTLIKVRKIEIPAEERCLKAVTVNG
jgi:hypothetical protein